jgi:hypothetical protein
VPSDVQVGAAAARAAAAVLVRLRGLPDLLVCRPELAEPILAAMRSSS